MVESIMPPVVVVLFQNDDACSCGFVPRFLAAGCFMESSPTTTTLKPHCIFCDWREVNEKDGR
jgi:hypothetical protein